MRFVFQSFFEVFLSTLILTATLASGQAQANPVFWLLIVLTLVATMATIGFLVSRVFEGGPSTSLRVSPLTSQGQMIDDIYNQVRHEEMEVSERNAGIVLESDPGCPVDTEENLMDQLVKSSRTHQLRHKLSIIGEEQAQ